MFKKSQDQMFRKAQMKLFSMIVSILLAVFIALIGSINVITRVVMRGQSREVLMKIAAGTEYDDVNSKFTFTPPDEGSHKENKQLEPPPQKHSETAAPTDAPTTQKPTASATSSTSEKATETETNTGTNIPATEAEHNEPAYTPDNNDQPEEVYEEHYDEPTPSDVQPAEPQQPEVVPDPPTQGQDNNGGDQNNQWNGQWGDQNNNQWNGQWGDPNNNQWNGQWGDQNNNQWNNGYNPWAWNPWMWWNPWAGGAGVYSNEKSTYGSCDTNTEFDHDAYIAEHGGGTDGEIAARAQSFSNSEGGIKNLSYNGGEVLEGFTVLSNDSAYEKTAKAKNTKEKYVSEYKPNNLSNSVKEEPIPRTLGSIDFFVIMADKSGKYLATLNNDDIDAKKAQSYITAILDKDLDTGMLNSYQFYQTDKPNGYIMVFTDKSNEMDMLKQLKRTTIIIGSIALVILSALAYLLSKKSIQPIKTAFDKQKQFVSDASHELKTPLTVISTNADVLEGEIGENRWLTYIKSQTDRMSVLVNDLLNLTRLENSTVEFERKYFNMSKAIVNTALPFECQAFESNKKFEVDVADNIMLCGSEQHIKQMAAIFIDNALKYSNDGGIVRVSLKKVGDKKVLSIYNTGQGVKEEDTEKIFERFYRSDESRNRATGGYGLGLAIAKSIIDKHKFKIHVMNQPGKSVCFMITM